MNKKAFLLFQNAPSAGWTDILAASRNKYTHHRDHFLKYINHPELLAEASVDPLADDPDVSGFGSVVRRESV
jgi:TBC1 domain family member 5